LPLSFKDYVLTGRFNKVASQAVADAIARTKAAGLPVESCVDGVPPSQNRPVQTGANNEPSDRLSRRQDTKSIKSKGPKTAR
jgi:hypothetical protein